MRDLLQRLGLAAYGGNYESVRHRLSRLGALEERFRPRAERRPQTLLAPCREDLLAAVAGATSLAGVLRALGCRPTGSSYQRIRELLQREGVDALSLPGQAWSRGRQDLARKPLDQMLVRGRRGDAGHLKKRLLREGVFEARCSVCLITRWRGRPAPLELDHVNGDRSDNRLENLRLLCPNCHAQTPTYRGKNIGRADLDETYSADLVERPDGGTGETREA